ncbi:hypothetical protein GCM10027028_12820 [Streptomyces sundarbansensis]
MRLSVETVVPWVFGIRGRHLKLWPGVRRSTAHSSSRCWWGGRARRAPYGGPDGFPAVTGSGRMEAVAVSDERVGTFGPLTVAHTSHGGRSPGGVGLGYRSQAVRTEEAW